MDAEDAESSLHGMLRDLRALRVGERAQLMTTQQALRVIVKPVVFVAALGPVAWLAWAGLTGHLSANPLSDLTNETGLWAIRFLCISLGNQWCSLSIARRTKMGRQRIQTHQ